jgi:hypothetical protein
VTQDWSRSLTRRNAFLAQTPRNSERKLKITSTQRIKKRLIDGFVFIPVSQPTHTLYQGKSNNKDETDPAYWPLIKQVRIWVKAEALSTGAVLCDLPGTADTNAARSNVAKQYMKNANCIWIFASIQRAVNDQTARGIGITDCLDIASDNGIFTELLGNAFKAQLLMGKYQYFESSGT